MGTSTSDTVCSPFPSCDDVVNDCGASAAESCCASPLVDGGTFDRVNDDSYAATVSNFRLDKFEVTVARFRRFVAAWTEGWRPSAGAGKHAHVNGGNGLANATGSPVYENGWEAAWNTEVGPTDAALACNATYATWTPTAGANERRPVNCVNWYEAYAFCVWDGGFLPSEAEWNYAAAGGSAQRVFPWGTTSPGANAELAIYDCYYNGTGTCSGVTNIAPVGSATDGDGLYGQSDLAGNVWEWNLDAYAATAAAFGTGCNNCFHLDTDLSITRTVRGGSFDSTASVLRSDFRTNSWPEDRFQYFGFRCARAP